MEVSDKFHLRWKDFESNISDALKCLREEEDFFDVTLVTQDEKTIQAHKVSKETGSGSRGQSLLSYFRSFCPPVPRSSTASCVAIDTKTR